MTDQQDQNHLEIYKQRYETWRYLDRLRWQMFQIAVLTTAFVLGFKGGPQTNILAGISYVGIGIVFIVLGRVSKKIGDGIIMTSKTLRKFGKEVGDTDIPEATKHGIAFKIVKGLYVAGILCIVIGALMLANKI